MSEQDEREVLLNLLTHLPAGVTEEGQEVPLLYMLPESAREYLCDAILTAGFHLAPATELKAEALEEAADALEAMVDSYGPGSRNTGYDGYCDECGW